MLRFYKGGISIDDIRNMTLEQFENFSEQMSEIIYMESGEQKPLTGKSAIAYAKLHLRRK